MIKMIICPCPWFVEEITLLHVEIIGGIVRLVKFWQCPACVNWDNISSPAWTIRISSCWNILKSHLHFNEQKELSCGFNICSCRYILEVYSIAQSLTIWVSILFMIIEDGKNCVHSIHSQGKTHTLPPLCCGKTLRQAPPTQWTIPRFLEREEVGNTMSHLDH